MSRRRYRFDPNLGALVEITDDWEPTPRTPVVTDLYMDGQRSTDGADIGSRKKRREYMRANNLADASDFKETWAKAARERAKYFKGDFDHARRKEQIARAIYEHERRRR